MWTLIGQWLYKNAMAIFISTIASLIISKRYFDKGNRESVLMTVIFPIVKLLEENHYTRKAYEALFDINSSYNIKYLRKKERDKLLALLSAYRDVCRYSAESADTSCIMSYYNYKLKENGVNPKPCAIKDDDGIIVADDFPPDYNYLQDYVYEVVSSYDFIESPEECSEKIADAFGRYTKKYYTDKEIVYFKDYPIRKVIELSEVSKKWNDKFKLADERKDEFLELPICRRVKSIINESSVNEYVKNRKSLETDKNRFTQRMIRELNALKDTKYSSIYVVVCLVEQSVVLEALKDITHLIEDEMISTLIYVVGGIISFGVLLFVSGILIKRARRQIEDDVRKQIENKEDSVHGKTDKLVECATMIGYLSPLLCISTWLSAFENMYGLKWGIIVFVHILGIGMPLFVKKKNRV